MSAGATREYTITLSEQERRALLDVLEEILQRTLIEEHRTEAFHAKEVVRARRVALESLLQKTRAAGSG